VTVTAGDALEESTTTDEGDRTPGSIAPDRIVVGVDGSEGAGSALEWAAAQAKRTGATLEIHTASGPESVISSSVERAERMELILERAAEHARRVAPDIVTTLKAYDGVPSADLIEATRGAGLLVVGSRGRGGFRGLLLGSVSRQCVHRAGCPVVVVRPPAEQAAPVPTRPTGRIVVGVDGRPSSLAALEWAARQAALCSGTVDAVTTWELPNFSGAPVVIPAGYDPGADAQRMLDGAVATARSAHPNVAISTTVVQGHPAAGLVELSRGADMLAIGSRGHGDFADMVLGSVSEHCVVHAPCPVLVFRHS
jgi:nucleotide-binding universal stress UspA family protein